ncbi:MAG: FIST C-terminal domain-containing protein, partial [Phycisphaeraceae bacterium]|nr:FIST C-terminal domain-containing protein [Phycisphaeraceae bacterium]
ESSQQALSDVLEQLGDGRFDLILCFATYHHRDDLKSIQTALTASAEPRALLGVTAAGVLGDRTELEGRPGLSVLAGRLGNVALETFDAADVADLEPRALQEHLSIDGGPPSALLLLADPFTTPLVRLLPALNETFENVSVIGGLASGGAEPGSNRLMCNGQLRNEGLVGLKIGPGVSVDCLVSQGCRPVGRPYVITKAKNNLIQELGQKPVMEVVGELAEEMTEADQQLLQQGLFVGRVIDEYRDHFDRGDFLVRNIIGVDQEAGYIAVNDLIRVGQTVQFHLRDADSATEDLQHLLKAQQHKDPGLGALLCSCNGRGSALFGRADAETQLIQQAIGPLPLGGFFAAGEIGPIGGENFVHGFTASLAVFRNAAGS